MIIDPLIFKGHMQYISRTFFGSGTFERRAKVIEDKDRTEIGSIFNATRYGEQMCEVAAFGLVMPCAFWTSVIEVIRPALANICDV